MPRTVAIWAAGWLVVGAAACAGAAPSASERGAANAESATAAGEDAAETARLHAFFDRYWQESAERHPIWATFRGDHRYDDRWDDVSPEGVAATDAWTRDMLAQALAFRRERLAPADQVSLDVFVHNARLRVARQRFDGHRRMTIGHFGFQGLLAGVMRAVPSHRPGATTMALARLRAYPARVDQEIDHLRGGIALGWVPARPVLERALAELDGQLAAPLREGPYFEPWRKQPAETPGRDAQAAEAEAVIRDRVLPAQQRLRRAIVDELLPAAPPDGSLSRYPDGEAVYALLVRQHTTTDLTPQQVHALGQQELARLGTQIAAVQRELGVDGGMRELMQHLRQPKYMHDTPEAMLEHIRAIAKRLDAEMPRLFAELPRLPYGVRAMPTFLGAGAPDSYTRPPADGSGPGWYNANVLAYKGRPRWALPTLVAHEAVPGHHLQIARALEIDALPAFRRQGHITAFTEGWALYAETLGASIGLYDTPEARFGHLQAQALRAARLVVDTGLHTQGWSRQRAIDFMLEHTGEAPDFVASEVDRYVSNPGQALAYMVGKLRIDAQRDRARAALGERFDLRRFHNAVLDAGPLPLAVLDAQIDAWIETERAR